MPRSLVSVIVINYNTFDLTCQCLAGIYKLTKSEFEIIVVDNASTECDPEVIKVRFPLIKLVKSETNIGFAKGNNLGIEQAKGQYVLLLNSDTILKNDALTISRDFLDANSQVAVASARLEYPDGRVQHNCQRFPSILYLFLELLRFQKIFPPVKRKLFGPFFDYKTVAYPDWVWGTFFMFRKDCLEKLPQKRLADDFFMYVEDMQWCKEFRKLGMKVAFVPEARIIHLMGASGGKRNELMIQNMNIFMDRYYPAWRRKLIQLLNFMLTARYAT